MSHRRARGLSLIGLVLVTAVACTAAERPDAATWLPTWEAVVALIPDEGDIGDPPDQSLCQATLAQIREQREGLTPTPLATVDDLTLEWVGIAETAFFECPPQGEDIDSFTEAYQEMVRVQESILTALQDRG